MSDTFKLLGVFHKVANYPFARMYPHTCRSCKCEFEDRTHNTAYCPLRECQAQRRKDVAEKAKQWQKANKGKVNR